MSVINMFKKKYFNNFPANTKLLRNVGQLILFCHGTPTIDIFVNSSCIRNEIEFSIKNHKVQMKKILLFDNI